MMTIEEVRLVSFVEDILLEFAELSKADITNSDLQGVAGARARQIIKMVRGGR